MLGKSFDVELKKTNINSGAVSYTYPLLLAPDPNGDPLVRVNTEPLEAAQAGRRGTIVIPGFEGGAGQVVARKPNMYEWNTGWQADREGVIRNSGGFDSSGTPGASNYAWVLDSVGNAANQGMGSFIDWVDDSSNQYILTPNGVYKWTGALNVNPTLLLSPAASSFFTDAVPFGDRVFIAQEGNTNGTSGAMQRILHDGTTVTGLSVASYVCVANARLFRLRQDGTYAYVSWTDQTATDTPTWSTEYVLPLNGRVCVGMDPIGVHVIIAVAPRGTSPVPPSDVYAMDSEGRFISLLPKGMGRNQILLATPFMGGIFMPLTGRPAAIWMKDLLDFDVLGMDAFAFPNFQVNFPALTTTRRPAFAAASIDQYVYVAAQATTLPGGGKGFVIMEGKVGGQQVEWVSHQMFSAANGVVANNGAVPVAIRARSTSGGNREITAVWTDATNSKMYMGSAFLWGGNNPPTVFVAGFTPTLHTSTYYGEHWATKEFTRIRGWLSTAAATTFNLTYYIDEVATANPNLTVTTTGKQTVPINLSFPAGVYGRSIALDFTAPANVAVQVEFPLTIDYIATPDQFPQVRLGILAGEGQINREGQTTKVSRKDLIENLRAIVETEVSTPGASTPFKWTLTNWYDGRPDWTVIPLKVDVQELEEQHRPGAGAAICWLTCQRIA